MLSLDQLRRYLRPLQERVANSIARAVVQLVDDSKKRQLVQLGVLDGETVDDGEHFQPYGYKSVPLPGAEAVVNFPNGDRAHPIVVVIDDRRHRPTGWEPGEVGLYNNAAAVVRLKADGTTEITGGGAAGALATKADLDALRAAIQSTVIVGGDGGAALKTAILAASWTAGTTKLKAE